VVEHHGLPWEVAFPDALEPDVLTSAGDQHRALNGRELALQHIEVCQLFSKQARFFALMHCRDVLDKCLGAVVLVKSEER